MPDGTGTNQGQRNTGHSPEILSESPPATGLQAFREAAEQVGKDPNAEYTAEMVKLDKEKLPENQEKEASIKTIVYNLERIDCLLKIEIWMN